MEIPLYIQRLSRGDQQKRKELEEKRKEFEKKRKSLLVETQDDEPMTLGERKMRPSELELTKELLNLPLSISH